MKLKLAFTIVEEAKRRGKLSALRRVLRLLRKEQALCVGGDGDGITAAITIVEEEIERCKGAR